MEKTLSPEQMAYISDLMRPLADKSDPPGGLITCQVGGPDGCDLAAQFVEVFRDAGWDLPVSPGYNQWVGAAPPQGVGIYVNAPSLTDSQIRSGEGLPPGAYDLLKALKVDGINVELHNDPRRPTTSRFWIFVGSKP
jgi:hypothetical protein